MPAAATMLQNGTTPSPTQGHPHAQTSKGSIQAQISYTVKTADPLRIYVGNAKPEGEPVSNRIPDAREVTVHDLHALREAGQEFTLAENGFQLVDFDVPEDTFSWDDKESVEKHYYAALEKLLLKHTGARRAHVFDYTLRRGTLDADSASQTQRNKIGAGGRREPVSIAHVDYSEKSGPGRLAELLPEEHEQLKQRPYAVIQIWRPLKGPVLDSPLGFADATTVAPEDLMENTIYFENRQGSTAMVAYNPAHKWYYRAAMPKTECFLFCCYDSRKDLKTRFTPHTGFRDPTTPADAPPRESVESRAYVFY